jgi:hypothetical protein
MSSCLEESHEWNNFANLKCTHFLFCKTGLRSAWMNWHNWRQDCNLEELINQANQSSNKLHPRSTTLIARTQKSRENLPTWWSIFFLGKEWWHLGEDIIRSMNTQGWFTKIANGTTKSRKLAPQWGASWWSMEQQWRCTRRIHWTRCEIRFKEVWPMRGHWQQLIATRLSRYLHSGSRLVKMGYRQTTLERLTRNNKLARFQTKGKAW